jgi:hypothetical protein
VVPGGGISADGTRWISCRPGFFLPVRVLSRLFRRLFLKYLGQAFDSGSLQFSASLEALSDPQEFAHYLKPVRDLEWCVYAKPPFAGPAQVLDYVGRYTHRVAISNNRLVDSDDGHVRFRWKDYRNRDRHKTMTLSAEEFIHRFLIHVLPNRFQRIRYFGFLSNRRRQHKLTLCRQLLAMPSAIPEPDPARSDDYRDRLETLAGVSLRQCPACRQGAMIRIQLLVAVTTATLQDTS